MVPGGGPEQAARKLRYGILNSYARENRFDCILLAHNRDDNRETLLMRFFNGSGPEGLKGIPASRDRLRRPLLGVGGRELRDYLADRGIGWCEDSTNSSDGYLRNRIRNRLLPLLDDIFPGWDSAADTLLQRSAEAAVELESIMSQNLPDIPEPDRIRWGRADWEKAGDYSRGLALLKGINRLESEADSRIPWSRIRELREGADRGQDRSAGGFGIVNSPDSVSLIRESEHWEGRTVFLSLGDLQGWCSRIGSMLLRAAPEKPDSGTQDISVECPFEIRWRSGRAETGFQICPSNGKPMNISPERPVKLTEKQSGNRTPDADNHIVYIHIEKE